MEDCSTFSSFNSNTESALNLSSLSGSSKNSPLSQQNYIHIPDLHSLVPTKPNLIVRNILGKGSQATVLLCSDQNDSLVAVKLFKKEISSQDKQMQEVHLENIKQEL